MTRPARTTRLLAAACALGALASQPAGAWEPATAAGLTERAAVAAGLHKLLIERLDLPLGLYEPLRLTGRVPGSHALEQALLRLDPEGGYRPDDGKQSALGWLAAGAVLEGVPASRLRHHFLEPSTGRGLYDRAPQKLRTRLQSAVSGTGTLRGVFTGTNFDGTGRPATAWLTDAENEWGLPRFLDERERAASAPTPAEREAALVRALLSAGALVRIVADVGDPAYVRNDYRVALEADGARLEHLVAERYGRAGLPDPGEPVQRAHLAELLHDPTGGGLADRTARRFFSPGSLPGSEGSYPLPEVTAGATDSGYVAGDAVARLVGFRRTPQGTEWLLDARTREDYAAALLPEIGRYTVGALELLFRGRIELEASGDKLTATLRDVGLARGTIAFFAEGPDHLRKALSTAPVAACKPGDPLGEVPRPSWAIHATAVVRGVDENGEPLVVVQETALK